MRFIVCLVLVLIANTCAAQSPLENFFSSELAEHEKRLNALETTVAGLLKAEPVKATLPTPTPATAPKPVKQIPAQVAATGGPHWTYPGDITTHLTGTHGANVAGLSIEQQLSLHDALHENRRVVPVQMYSAPVYRSSCPGGVCPQRTQTTRGGGGGWYLGRNMGW